MNSLDNDEAKPPSNEALTQLVSDLRKAVADALRQPDRVLMRAKLNAALQISVSGTEEDRLVFVPNPRAVERQDLLRAIDEKLGVLVAACKPPVYVTQSISVKTVNDQQEGFIDDPA